ncbi:MAG: hypothetical protein ACREK6_12185 [Candidatus Rokuibacteriota bacterium]
MEILIADLPTYNGKDRKDVLIRQIREAIAEENRKDIIERLWKGRQERVRRGLPAGGNLPYGFARSGKEIVLVAEEIRIVRLIFEAADLDVTKIATVLNERMFTRRNGKCGAARQVAAILARRPLYYDGMIRYGEASGQNPHLAVIGNDSDRCEERDSTGRKKRNGAALKRGAGPPCSTEEEGAQGRGLTVPVLLGGRLDAPRALVARGVGRA